MLTPKQTELMGGTAALVSGTGVNSVVNVVNPFSTERFIIITTHRAPKPLESG